MVDYGREWSRRPGQRSHRGTRGRYDFEYGFRGTSRGEFPRRRIPPRFGYMGREPGIEEGFGYGMESGYGVEMRRGAERGFRAERGYRTSPGYETERGYRGREYGVWSDYGERHLPAEYGYEFGRGRWPSRRYGGREGRYGGGPAGLRRARERASLPREEHLYGREFARHEYGRRYPAQRFRGAGGGYAEEYFEEEPFGAEEFGLREEFGPRRRYGHTPVDRWPDTGHDVDHLDREELTMDDGEIREAVLENLFQDSWIDPDRIDVDVQDGVVTLTGEVRDFMEARYAWDDAWETAGVRGVINNLTVRADIPSERMEMPQTASGERTGGGRGRG